MMEVKQNTAVDLNDLLAPVKNHDGTDDVVMTDLTEGAHELNCDIMKATEKSNNGLVTNGDETLSSLIDLDSTNVLDTPVNAELEDALLAEEDVLPKLSGVKVNSNIIGTSSSVVVDDILADKVETSNSTTSSNNVRDPGDDLDTLLSKINDIVDDCLENEVTDPVVEEERAVAKPAEEDNIHIPVTTNDSKDESVILLEDTIAEDSCVENSTTQQNVTDNEGEESSEVPLPEEEETNLAEGEESNEAKLPEEEESNDIKLPEEEESNDVKLPEEEESNEMKVPEEEEPNEMKLAEESTEITDNVVTADHEVEDEPVVTSTDVDKTPEESDLDSGNNTENEKISAPAAEEEDAQETHTTELLPTKANSTEAPSDEILSTEDTSNLEDATKTITDIHMENHEETVAEVDKTKNDVEAAIMKKDEEVDEIKEDELLEEDKMDDMDLLEEGKVNENELLDEPTTNDVVPENTMEDDEKLSEKDSTSQDITGKKDVKDDEHKPKSEEKEPQNDKKESKEDEQGTKVEGQESKTEEQKAEDTKMEKELVEYKSDTEDAQDKKIDKQGKSEEKVENEDSDDDIVFYVDKPPENEKNTKTKCGESELSTISSVKQTDAEAQDETKDKTADEDDVVILDDDDEMQGEKKLPESSQTEATTSADKTSNEETKTETPPAAEKADEDKANGEGKHSTIDIDNSDNARDDFVVSEKTTEETKKPKENEESNSNCSSSSNLLLEAKQSENTGDEPTPEDNENENEEEDDDGDVELIETESKEADLSEKTEDCSEIVPPAKRPRLSEDSEVSSKTDETSKSRRTSESTEKKLEISTEGSTTGSTTAVTSTSLKRTHDVIELELDDDKSNDSKYSSTTQTINKKARTEESSSKEGIKAQITDTDNKPAKIEIDTKPDTKKDIVKMIPSDIPIPLYPPPKFKNLSTEESISLGFMKKFRKTFDKMTKQDLEELVLQKVVEAIIHRSEFSEMRELIEKQEKLITSHRSKISELSKQFRDLEMVHNRVVKDIEQRNSQFIMPVKITRAVGLQVYIPNKKAVLESTAASTNTSNLPGLPTVSPQRTATSSTQSNLTSPQRQYHSTQSSADASVRITGGNTSSSSSVNSSTISSSSLQRRGCAQKVTPIRPVPSGSATSAGASSGSAASTQVYRNNLNQNQISSQPRILNKNASTATVAGASSNANASPMQRQRFIQPNQDTSQRLQQQQQHSQQQQQGSRPASAVMNNQRGVTQQKLPTNQGASVQRRPEPTASTGSNSTASLDNYMNTLSQLTGGNTAVSITPAKPKEKAVIDLTDEDETPPAPPNISPQQTNNVSVNQGQRRSLPVQSSNTNSNIQQYGRTAPPLTRIPPGSQMANSNKNRQTGAQGQKSSSFSSAINTPPGTSITRINVAANTQGPQRVKYSHPAPLPATPPQAFNPSWKLPPPRPTIRISNLDNGIVISWTMEESMDRHAECVSYQIYAYQETSGPPMADSWRHVGDVKAMLLPMAVTLTQFQEGQRYFFAVRAVDCHQRYGPFSLPKTWS